MRVSDQIGAPWRGWKSTVTKLLAAAIILVCAPLNASANGRFIEFQDTPNVQKVRIVVNKSTTLQLGQPIGEALIANADIADVVPLSDTSLYLVGKKIGIAGDERHVVERETLVRKPRHERFNVSLVAHTGTLRAYCRLLPLVFYTPPAPRSSQKTQEK